MEGTVVTKIMRLAAYLATHPRDLPRWVSALRKSPVELGLPWIAWSAIDFLEEWLKPHHVVLELGAGGSTLFFARRAQHVVSVEPDERWRAVVGQALERKGLKNVTLLREICDIQGRFDLVLIDHDEPPWNCAAGPTRVDTFWSIIGSVRKGGIIVVDDSWRHPQLRQAFTGPVRTFRSVGPARPGVTETDVFFVLEKAHC